jgi:116 kDa U5 small nuclear ribonucleoprotein component N-terminus
MQSNHGDEQPELYDEFGNYIGPDLDDDDEDDDSSVDDDELSVHDDYDEEEGMGRVNNSNNEDRDRMIIERDGGGEGGASERDVGGSSSSNAMIVLHEDKEHYASAEQVYGDGVKTVLLDEDAMDLSTPIVEPLTRVQHTASDPEAGGAAASSSHSAYVNYSDDYLGVQLSNETGRTRRGYGPGAAGSGSNINREERCCVAPHQILGHPPNRAAATAVPRERPHNGPPSGQPGEDVLHHHRGLSGPCAVPR